jgi:signal transduction histidine kinase
MSDGVIETHAGGREPPATSAVELFLDTIAHEVRVPLAVAKSAATAVTTLTGLGDAERDELLDIVMRNTDLALLLLDRMRIAKDIELDQVRLQTRPLDLAALVAETVSDLQLAALGDHPVDVVGSTSVAVEADSTALREILLNLLLNAAKYSPRDAPIEVAVSQGDPISVEVTDRGDGVSDTELEHIFGKYVQKMPGGGGVGLGLYISRGLARAHGGDLVASAGRAVGSRFVLTLPAPDTSRTGAGTSAGTSARTSGG